MGYSKMRDWLSNPGVRVFLDGRVHPVASTGAANVLSPFLYYLSLCVEHPGLCGLSVPPQNFLVGNGTPKFLF